VEGFKGLIPSGHSMAPQVLWKKYTESCFRGGVGKLQLDLLTYLISVSQTTPMVMLSVFQNADASDSEDLQRILHDWRKTSTTAQEPGLQSAPGHAEHQSNGLVAVRVPSDDALLQEGDHCHSVCGELD